MRNALLLSIVLGIVGLSTAYAQRGHSLSAGIGYSYYYGDLSDGFSNVFARPAGQISYGYYFTSALSVRFGLAYTQLGAADSLAASLSRQRRRLHFRTSVVEFSSLLYWDLRPDKRFGKAWYNRPHFSPHLFGGVAVFQFRPRAQYNGEWVDLQPLGTEGQNFGAGYPEPYSFLQVAIPFGGGISWRFSSFVAVSFDIGYRYTLTDYLDDVSTNYPDFGLFYEQNNPLGAELSDPSRGQPFPPGAKRGNPGVKDSYVFGLATFTLYLEGSKR